MKIVRKILSFIIVAGMIVSMSYGDVYAAEDTIVVEINEQTFPDKMFREHILTGSHYIWDENENQIEVVYDANKDGKLSKSEIDNVKQHLVAEMEIYDLTGIEYFTNIIELACQWTQIESLDLSKNTELQILNCYRTNLKGTLDLSKNIKLEGVSCARNRELTNIDVSGCTELRDINFESTSVASIDLSNNTKLFSVGFADTPMKEIDLSKNPELKHISCYNTNLTKLDISNNPKLEYVDCSANEIEELDLGNNLEIISLNLFDTKIKGIDVSANKKLEDLSIGSSFTWLNVGDNEKLIVNMSDGTADLTVEADAFDITEVFPGINPEKISSISGATLEGNIVSGYKEGTPVIYTYDCGTDMNGNVILNVTLNIDVIRAENPDMDESDVETDDLESEKVETVPKTGDNDNILLFSCVLMISGFVIATILRRRLMK